MARRYLLRLIVLGAQLGAGVGMATQARAADEAASPAPQAHEQGMVVLDYQVVPVPGLKSIDLMGFHFFRQFHEGVYLGVGGFAPLVKGEYGGFMAFDVSAHLQRRIHGRWFAAAGLSLGGGGGGKSAEQSKVLSGSGGYARAHAGLGYAFDAFSIGASVSRFRFNGSAIAHTQPNLFLQVPFSYTVGDYASAGRRLPVGDGVDGSPPAEQAITLSLDNFRQIDPQASNKSTINAVEMQYARFFAPDAYWFFALGLGYRGLPLYNQMLAGVGHRLRIAPGVNLYGQLGLGSGGYAPDTIDTGPGLLVYPKVSAEYLLRPDLGVSLSAGYLAAPRGTSRNATLGLALSYRINSGPARAAADVAAGGALHRGYRFNLMQQTEFDVRVADRRPDNIRMLTMQIDLLVDDRFYIPVQGSAAANAYVGYPGYGEVLVGAGMQTQYQRGERFQFFGQLLAGPNVHGLILKPQVGVNVSLGDRLALIAQAGRTFGLGSYGQNSSQERFRANSVSVGLTHRFSLPGH